MEQDYLLKSIVNFIVPQKSMYLQKSNVFVALTVIGPLSFLRPEQDMLHGRLAVSSYDYEEENQLQFEQ